ncbi:MAG: hypothetical protein P1P82_02320 [Bacteroidales bacterium]|nr:hypothetical protein [Bacteroidales bacterium]MDT8431118.1 hypothetical protein [Bacteroidales bacterium]
MRRDMNPDGTFTFVDKLPLLPEGEYGGPFREYVSNNIVYPIFAKMNGIWGQVETVFIVDTEGRIRNPGATNIISSDLVIEEIRVLYESPAWEPGVLGGFPVNVSMSWNFMFPDRPTLSLLDNNVKINFTEIQRDSTSTGESGEDLFYIVEEMPTFKEGILHGSSGNLSRKICSILKLQL